MRKSSLVVVVKPLIIRHSVAHVSVSNAIMRVRMAGDCGRRAAGNNNDSVCLARIAASFVIDENITSLDVRRRSLQVSASASPAVNFMKAVTEVLCADLFLTARVATAREALIKILMTTGNEALTHKVCAITTVAAITAVFTTIIRPWGARIKLGRAIVIGTVPPFLSISNSGLTIISGNKTA